GVSSDPYYLYNNFFSTANTAKVGEAAPVNVARFSDPAVDDALAVLKSTNPDDRIRRARRRTIASLVLAALLVVLAAAMLMFGNT
ncbi:hypothetical protein SB717_37625, partial [Priestia sp. SIMBA_032]|uniref:hypothetical protein n=1 Tax=Priestia sp. SIMBA_032 TaxID=3085775 RepID=UPI00397C893C